MGSTESHPFPGFGCTAVAFLAPLINVGLMPITLDQIVEETRHWPPEKVGELVGRLTEDLHASDPETDAAWKAEIARRIEEIQTGEIPGIPGEEVSARIRRILGQ